MESEELSELHEHAEHAKHDPTLAPISLTMAILAVLVAVVTLLGHRAHTEEVVLQAQSSDQWAYYQAKNIRKPYRRVFCRLNFCGSHHRCRSAGEIAREIFRRGGALQRRAKANRR